MPEESSSAQGGHLNIVEEPASLSPQFKSLTDTDTFIAHINELVKTTELTSGTIILQQLLDQFNPLDYEILVFPEIEQIRNQLKDLAPDSDAAREIRRRLDRLRVNTKHFLVLTIENILKVAQENRWSLCKNHDFIYLYNGTFWSELDEGG